MVSCSKWDSVFFAGGGLPVAAVVLTCFNNSKALKHAVIGLRGARMQSDWTMRRHTS